MQWGSLVDALTTTPELVDSEYIVLPPDAPQRPTEAMMNAAKPSASSLARQKWWSDFESSINGRNIISADEMTLAQQAAKMLTETCKASADIFAKSKSQVIIAGRVLDVKCKGLLDLVPDGEDFLADLKTVNDFSLEGFAKATANFGYGMQAGIYLALWNASHPEDQRQNFRIIWQESEPPFEVCVTELAQQDIEAGWLYASVLIQRLIDATEKNHWPMFQEGKIATITRPTWAAIQEEAKLTE
jgi:exodeoxyribonuclease VIII